MDINALPPEALTVIRKSGQAILALFSPIPIQSSSLGKVYVSESLVIQVLYVQFGLLLF
jgi:hypothetical protein